MFRNRNQKSAQFAHPLTSQRVICSFIARGKSPFNEDRQKGPTACQRSPYSLASAGLEDLCKHRRTQMLSSDGGITGITISHLTADLQTPSSENILSRRDSKWRHPMCKNSTGVRAYVHECRDTSCLTKAQLTFFSTFFFEMFDLMDGIAQCDRQSGSQLRANIHGLAASRAQ